MKELKDLRYQVRAKVGYPSVDAVPDYRIDNCLLSAVEAVQRRISFCWRDYQVNLEADLQEYPLHPDITHVEWVMQGGRLLEKTDMRELRSRKTQWTTGDTQLPMQYVVYSDRLILIPAPSAAAVAEGPLTLRGIVSPGQVLSSGGPEGLHPADRWLLIYGAAAEYYFGQPETVELGKALWERMDREAALVAARYQAQRIMP